MNRAAKVAIPYAGWVPVPCFGSRGPDHASRLVTRPSGPSIMGRAASCRRAGRPKRSARARIRSQAWLFTSSGPIQRRAPFLRRTQERSTTHAPSTSGSEQSRPAPRLRRRSFRFAPLGARPTPRARGRTSTTAILNQPKQRFSLDRRRPSIEARIIHEGSARVTVILAKGGDGVYPSSFEGRQPVREVLSSSDRRFLVENRGSEQTSPKACDR